MDSPPTTAIPPPDLAAVSSTTWLLTSVKGAARTDEHAATGTARADAVPVA